MFRVRKDHIILLFMISIVQILLSPWNRVLLLVLYWKLRNGMWLVVGRCSALCSSKVDLFIFESSIAVISCLVSVVELNKLFRQLVMVHDETAPNEAIHVAIPPSTRFVNIWRMEIMSNFYDHFFVPWFLGENTSDVLLENLGRGSPGTTSPYFVFVGDNLRPTMRLKNNQAIHYIL